jgi:glycosyltransferase involved in cell wall biosynthesis
MIGRENSFNYIFEKVKNQIIRHNLTKEVELIYAKDQKKLTIGAKRNYLVSRAIGNYICFLDDDDDISDDYIFLIYSRIKENRDCISLTGIYTENGQNEAKFIHSIKYKKYFQDQGVLYRPPNHLNPIKRDLIKNIKFKEISHGEDTDWAMSICNKEILKTESEINYPYYFYNYITNKYR